MPIADKNRIYDGFVSLEGGADAGRATHLIDANQCAEAQNLTFRGGFASTRPGIRKLDETFTNPNHSYTMKGLDAGQDANGNDIVVPGQEVDNPAGTGRYRNGIFQCAIGYSPHSGSDCLMALIDGRLFQIIPEITTAKVTEIPLAERNRQFNSISYMVQADKFMFAQDGFGKAIIYDGNKARRSDSENTDREKTEIPVGTIMAYGMGRVVVVVNKRDIAFGDLFGSHDLPDPSDSLPFFTERNFLAEGFDAAIPFQLGLPTALVFFPQLDTSTGNGQLLAFAERGASAFVLSLPREEWKTSQFQILALLTTGLRGHRSIGVVNEDLWFRGDDGIRTFRQARSESTGWAHIPASTNVRQYLDTDTDSLLKYASTIYFDNRIITTTSPYWNQGRVFHKGLVVADFDILSAFGTRNRPAWDGYWHKMRISQLVTGNFNGITRAFIFGLDDNDKNQLYELSVDDRDDFDGLIEWEMDTRAFDFKGQSTPFQENELYDADIWLRDIIE